MSETQPISGKMFLQRLSDHGIIGQGDKVRRVVIDAHVGKAAMLYVERVGDDRLLKVIPSLDGIEVSSVPATADES